MIHLSSILAKTKQQQQKKKKKKKKTDNVETLSVWELNKAVQCILPSLCRSQYLPLSILVIFILFAAQRPHHLSARLCAVILSALTRRVLPDAHLEMG